ncbi:glutathionylspermidine synthase family protein [Streptomyces sp. NPDC003023]|uniref:glutathionylspermidine synthase family protein n=1 Tax=Streptomyces sp. NPDC003023 TaxID=3364675 RepID=UPI0036B92718
MPNPTLAARSADLATDLYTKELARPHSSLADIDLNTDRFPYLQSLGFKYLNRPVLLQQRQVDSFGDDLLQLAGLLTTIHERLFDGDLTLLCQDLGIPEAHARLMCRTGARRSPLFGRVDTYDDGESLKILEFNASSDTGGLHWTTSVSEALLEFPQFRAYADTHGLRHIDTLGLLVDNLRDAAAHVSTDRDDPVIAIIEGPGGLEEYGHLAWIPLNEKLRERGLDSHVGEITDLRLHRGRIHLGDRRVDLVYRVFEMEQVVHDPEALSRTEDLLSAYEEGHVALWTPPETEAFRNKRCMTYLSDPLMRSHLTPEEARIIDRRLPWTRSLTGPASLTESEFSDRLLEDREHLILKPDDGFDGRGIVRGWETDENTWRQALQEAADHGRAVVQKRIVPITEEALDPLTGHNVEWQTCWGFYYFPTGFGGGRGRMVPVGSHSDVYYKEPLLAGLFTHPGHPQPTEDPRP